MKKIELKKIISENNPSFIIKYPAFLQKIIITFLEKLLKIDEVNRFISENYDKEGITFVDSVFEHIDFSYTVSSKEKDRIPSEGKLIIVSNHPLGGLDGLALLRLIYEVRRDVKILANDILMNIENLNDFFIPVNLSNAKNNRESLSKIEESLKNEEAIIIFPAGKVSRLSLKGIRDSKWSNGAIHFARKFQTPILPVYVQARNSILFYLSALLSDRLSMLMLPRELFNKRSNIISIKVGKYIPPASFSRKHLSNNAETSLLRKHTIAVGKNKKGIFLTEQNIIHPVDRKSIKAQLLKSNLLGTTFDGKKIYLVNFAEAPDVVKEIARLRELTFRKVGEGTGKKMDADIYDKYYKHLVLWDDDELEVVGSYRIGICKEILNEMNIESLYTSTLFTFSERFKEILPHSIELGRSFIQEKYWNSSALDYLWQGIGSFIYSSPGIKYLFGAVSLSDSYPDDAKNLIIYFYSTWFGDDREMARSNEKYSMSYKVIEELKKLFPREDYKKELKLLKERLKIYGSSIPTLYKQYADLCEENGVKFFDFNIDKDFNNCIDGLIFVNIDMIKENKKERYIKNRFMNNSKTG